MKYEKWLTTWLDGYAKTNCKKRTYEKYRSQVEHYIIPTLGKWEMKELTAIILQQFVFSLCQRGLAANTVNGIISVVKNSLKVAVSLNIVEKEYSARIIRPKYREKKVGCFTKEEQKNIEKYILNNHKKKLFGIIICLYSGLRIGELLALEWSDVDFGKGQVSVSKSCHDSWVDGKYVKVIESPKTPHSIRLIPLPKPIMQYLKYIKKSAHGTYVISGGNPYGEQVRSYQKLFEGLLKKLGISHKGFHALRHTFATRALECGMDVKTLSELLGHGNPNITLRRYAHSFMEHKQQMMEKLGELFHP